MLFIRTYHKFAFIDLVLCSQSFYGQIPLRVLTGMYENALKGDCNCADPYMWPGILFIRSPHYAVSPNFEIYGENYWRKPTVSAKCMPSWDKVINLKTKLVKKYASNCRNIDKTLEMHEKKKQSCNTKHQSNKNIYFSGKYIFYRNNVLVLL